VSTETHERTAIRVTLYGRADCHLCHEMRAVVDEVVRTTPGVIVEEIDVDRDPALVAAYGADVPVLCIDGARAFVHRVAPAALRARLVRGRG
jgi:glutaredoxin